MNILISLVSLYFFVGFAVVWWLAKESVNWSALVAAYVQAAKWPHLLFTKWSSK